MYADLCLSDRIDGDAFARVLRRHALGDLDARAACGAGADEDPAGSGGRISAEQERLLGRLEPLYATVLRLVAGGLLQDLDRQGRGHGLAFKWAVLEVPPGHPADPLRTNT